MKLLVVGHPFLLAYNQKKYVAIKRMHGDLQLRLIVPRRGRDRFELTEFQVHPELPREEVVPLTAHFAGSHMTYVHGPGRIAQQLRTFQPDIVHMEAEPQALISVETIALRGRVAPRAAVTIFTWDNLVRNRRFPVGPIKRQLRRYSLARTSTMICGNREAADILNAEGFFHGQLEVLPQYGLDTTEYQPGVESELRAKLGLDGHLVVGHIGRLAAEKGIETLCEGLDGLRNHSWKLLLVGAGPLENEIRERWMARFPDQIVLVPAVPYGEVTRYLRCVDIFVLASKSTATWKEQFGLTLAQAMLTGIPVIGSSSGAIPDVLGPGGIVFSEGNSSELARALDSLLASYDLRQRFGTAGRAHALRNYTSEKVAAGYLAAFEMARVGAGRSKEVVRAAVAAPKP
jgi:glycosyltransferase involved in cell wall biosynthesis